MNVSLPELFEAAIKHGEDSEPDHEVGDLQDLLTEMWDLLTAEQRAKFLASETVRNVWEAAYGE